MSLVRYFVLLGLCLYVLCLVGPVADLQSFIPTEIANARRFALVVAHPDDESLFFSPTLVGLISRGKQGHLIVFSTGNSEGLGPVREKEAKDSCQRLGIDRSRCLTLNVSGIQDDPRRWWPKENVSQVIEGYVRQWQIDLLITFDDGGVSGHLNHRSLAMAMKHSLVHHRTLLVYELSTVSPVIKFTSIWNLFFTLIGFLPRLCRSFFSSLLPFLFSAPDGQRVLFVSSPSGYWTGLRAFHCHRSQMLWYRHIYTTLSRYMFINHLNKISVDND